MIVLGGGIGGLSAAHYLLKSGISEVKIFEAASSIGGWITSFKDAKTGLLFEKGPRTIRVNGPLGYNTLSLIEEIDIASKVKPILKDHPSAQTRYIYVNNKLCPLPTGFGAVFKKHPPFSKPLTHAILRDIIRPKKQCSDDNLYNFVERRFGSEVAEYLISPLICGICAGDAKEISVKFLMPSLFESEQAHGSVLKGLVLDLFKKKDKEPLVGDLTNRAVKEKWSVFGLEGGMQELPKAVSKSVINRGGQIFCNSKIMDLSLKKQQVSFKTGGKEFQAEHIISALPARNLAPLLQKEHPELAGNLASIPYVNVCVVNLAYKGNVLKQNAFGFLIPPSQNIPILGVIFDTCNFPQGDWTVLTAMLGGRWFDKYIGPNTTEDEIMSMLNKHLKSILGIEALPDSYHFSILQNCISQYVVGHNDKIKNVFSYIKTNKLPITLVGSSYKGVGINDVIMSAKVGVEEFIDNKA